MALNLNPGRLAFAVFRAIPLRYRFDIPKLVAGVLPHLLRKPKLLAYLNCLVTPVVTLYGSFVLFQSRSRRELSYNGQTLNFQRALNDRFDPALNRIRIIHADSSIQSVYINFVAEGEPDKYTKFQREPGPHLFLRTAVEEANQVGFIVRCPASLRLQEPALKARIGQLKLALVKYRIQYV